MKIEPLPELRDAPLHTETAPPPDYTQVFKDHDAADYGENPGNKTTYYVVYMLPIFQQTLLFLMKWPLWMEILYKSPIT